MSQIITAGDIQEEAKSLGVARDDVVSRAKALVVTTAEDVQAADAILQRLQDGIKTAQARLKKMRDSTTAAWREGVDLENSIVGPLEEAKKILSQKRGTASRAIQDAEAKRQREEREAEEKRIREEREAEAARLATLAREKEVEAEETSKAVDSALESGDVEGAIALETSAAVKTEEAVVLRETAAAVASAPVITAPAPRTSSFIPKSGVSDRESWSAEVTDLLKLVKAAAAEPEKYLAYLEANTKALNGVARAVKVALSIPGVRAVVNYSATTRGGGAL